MLAGSTKKGFYAKGIYFKYDCNIACVAHCAFGQKTVTPGRLTLHDFMLRIEQIYEEDGDA